VLAGAGSHEAFRIGAVVPGSGIHIA
jgi:hypothetical protein